MFSEKFLSNIIFPHKERWEGYEYLDDVDKNADLKKI